MPFIFNVVTGRKKASGGGGGGGGSTPVPRNLAAGQYHSLYVENTGVSWTWGLNNAGQLGDNSITNRCTPVSVLGESKTFCQITAGLSHIAAIDNNGRAWAWGPGGAGQLGNNSTASQTTPVSVLGATKTFCKIGSGNFHTVAIDKNGQAWAWGQNNFGQLGDNTTAQRLTPVSVLGATKTFCQIAAGYYHNLAIDKNGRAWAWGYNRRGQLGNSSIIVKYTPVSVCGAPKTFCQIDAGQEHHSVAIDKNGQAWAWGQNFGGALGNNGFASETTPVSVCGAPKTFCQISAGYYYNLAIDKNGQAWAWGWNIYGNLGDNSTISKRTPVSVLGATKTFCQICAGDYHSLAVDNNGLVWSWGYNYFGQLGDNTTTSRITPVRVCNL